MSITRCYYFYGDPIIMIDNGYHNGRFWITCKITFIYLMEKTNFDYHILHMINGEATKYADPELDTYYIECDDESFNQLIRKYCAITEEGSIKDDWDLYGSEFGKVEKKLHTYDIWGGQVLFSRSEKSDCRFYVSCSDSFHELMRRVIDYKEIQMDDTDRFKNKENFKLIECDEESIFRLFYRLCMLESIHLSLVKRLSSCE